MLWKSVVAIALLVVLADKGDAWRSSSSSSKMSSNANHLNIGLIAPHTNFGKREYIRAIGSAVQALQKPRGIKLTFLKDYVFQAANVHFDMMSLTPSPTGT